MRRPVPRSRLGSLSAGLAFAGIVCLLLFTLGTASASGHGAIDHQHRISQATTDPPTPYEAFDAVTLAAADMTGDGVKEIVTHNDNNHAYVFDGASGALLAELSTNHPDGWTPRELAGPALGDVTENGVTDIVLANSAAWVTAFEARPTGDHRKIEVTELWETRLDPEHQAPDRDWKSPGLDAPPFLADTNDGGRDEAFTQLDDQSSVFKLSPDGHVQHWNDHSDGNGGPLVADLTGNGAEEAVFPSDGGLITVYDADSMSWHCQFNARHHDTWPASISVSPTLADLTSDGRLEIVFGVRNVPEEQYDGWIEDAQAHYFAVGADCNIVWQKTWEWSNPHVHTRPAPVDVTGDGQLDVVFQDWNTVGHKPGNWEHTGPSNLFALDGATGDLLWRNELANYWSNKNIALGDVTGDGQVEILANEVDSGDGLGLYGLDGSRKGFVSAPDGWVVSRGPTLADLDADGTQEILLPVHRDSDHCSKQRDVGCREGALQIYDTPSSATPVYDNNHLRNEDEAQARPPSGTDGGTSDDSSGEDSTSGEFDATFENVRGNEWWIETDVSANEPIASAHARIDGGSWFGLDKKSWGSWAEDEHAPEGAIVQLQARNSDGDRALSDCYAWGEDPSPTACPDGGSTSDDDGATSSSGDFDASFENVRGNEWWIELDVTSERDVTGVDARLDGGSWFTLEKQDWGSWAKSKHASEDTLVQFRAHSGSLTTTSGCWSWGEDPSTAACPEGTSGSDGDSTGDFDAEFDEPRGNEWWIEVDVTSEDSIASVSARTDGGSWFSLERTDWGSWAQNTHVGEGVTVEFRATNADGARDLSDPVEWPPD